MDKDHLITASAITICIVAFIAGVTYLASQSNASGQAFRMACLERGGSYLGTGDRICVMLKDRQ